MFKKIISAKVRNLLVAVKFLELFKRNRYQKFLAAFFP